MGETPRLIYLDWNATTPPHPDVVEAIRRVLLSAWGNPASVHWPGRQARVHVEAARDAVAALVGLDARDVVLAAGGTEANNLAMEHAFSEGGSRWGSARQESSSAPNPAGALVASRIEHP